jgi:conjugal transfer mating pair stabilization protein TraG
MWEIYAYHNSESLSGIFNAVAALMGSGTYSSAVAAVAFCGFIAAALAYAFAPEKLQGWKWIATVVLVYSVLFVPRVTVGIVDKTGGAPVRVVANVPFGIAALGGLTSSIGNTLTELLETAFQSIPGPGALASELAYQRNGLMFGNRLIRDTRGASIQDPNLRTDLINFVHNCTMYDLIDGTIDPAAFARSDDVWALMSNPNPARFTSVTNAGGIVDTVTCPQAYVHIGARLPGEIVTIQNRLAFKLNPTLPSVFALSAIAGQIQQAYISNQISSAAATAADIIRQNAVVNAINDASQIIGQKVNDPASLVLAVGRAQAVAQQNAAWINGGKIAEQSLPIVRNVVEAMTYALFPLFVLLLFLTSGRETVIAVKAYAVVLIWIQLWPPLYAILNYMATIYAKYDLAAAAEIGGGLKALSLNTASTIYSNAIAGEAVVGYLVASIPFIAWAALKRMETFGTAVVGGLSNLGSTVAASTSAAAVGNVGMGNVTMDQRVISPTASNAWVSRTQGLTGDWFTRDASGRVALSKLQNEGFASHVVSMRVSDQDVTEATRAAETARSNVHSASMEHSAVLADIYSKGAATLRGSRSSVGSGSSSFEETGSSLERVDQIIRSVSARTGVSESQVAQIAFGAAGHLGVGATSISPVKAGLLANASAGKSYSAGLSAEQQKVLNELSEEQVAVFKRFGDRATRDTSFVEAVATDAREAQDISSRLARSATSVDRAEAAYAERLSMAERLSSLRDRGVTISVDMARDPHNFEMFRRLTEDYGNSAAAMVLMENEIARQAPRPIRNFSDGTALPVSFDDVRAQREFDRGSPAFSPDVEAIKRRNDETTAKTVRGYSGPSPQPSGASNDIRGEVAAEGARITSQARNNDTGFDDKHQISVQPDGTLSSRTSLLKKAGRQVASDASNSTENAKDLVTRLLKKR